MVRSRSGWELAASHFPTSSIGPCGCCSLLRNDGRLASSGDFPCFGILTSAPLVICRQLWLKRKTKSSLYIINQKNPRNQLLVSQMVEISRGSSVAPSDTQVRLLYSNRLVSPLQSRRWTAIKQFQEN